MLMFLCEYLNIIIIVDIYVHDPFIEIDIGFDAVPEIYGRNVSDNTEVSIALNAAVNDIQFETNEIPRVTTEKSQNTKYRFIKTALLFVLNL